MTTDRPWTVGDRVAIPMRHGDPYEIVLDEIAASDLNAGENPIYPWKMYGPAKLLEPAEETPDVAWDDEETPDE